ncbi:MAG: carboxynorspermidine decarboxylase [Schwartzia sp.]|nr:carboxynorspermidine decarboxylase [Schwartzia sp. (in: firmicutes)]
MAKVWAEAPTPSYIVDEARLTKNLEILARVKRDTGCRILLAQKAFSMFHFYPLVRQYLDGSTASGLFEARLGKEEMGGETHVFSPAYREDEFDELLRYADHIVFNSFAEWRRYGEKAKAAGTVCGLRVNPEHSTQDTPIYDPCAPGSRLGVRLSDFEPEALDGISGLHFHTLCEQGAEPLAETLEVFEEKFGAFLSKMKWVNFGGGHHITKPGYNLALLAACIRRMKEKYGLTVYLEPGEAVAYHAGDLVTTVLDVVETEDVPVAVLDTSAACHMPDVIEMPYRPPLFGAGEAGEKAHTYRLAGPTCLAGDVIGGYSFDEPLARGTRLVFGDMAIYSMVKNNTFNGMALPVIVAAERGGWSVVRQFGYEDFKGRLS